MDGRRSGDEGAVVRENGEGAVGGGRWIKVRSGAIWWWTALGEINGSLIFDGGRSGLLVAYLRVVEGSARRRRSFMVVLEGQNAYYYS